MRKNLCSVLGFLALICAVLFVFSPVEKVSANEVISEEVEGLTEEVEIIPGDIEGLTEEYDLEEVEFVNAEDLEGSLNFDTVEELEAFLKSEKEKEMNEQVVELPTSPDTSLNEGSLLPAPSKTEQIMFATAATTTTKTYTFKEYTGVSTITSYAKVTRNTSGVVTKVVVWSSQTGLAFPISYSQNMTDYTLNSTKKGGKAYVYGTKSYGVTVGGQGLAYKRNVTYTVPF